MILRIFLITSALCLTLSSRLALAQSCDDGFDNECTTAPSCQPDGSCSGAPAREGLPCTQSSDPCSTNAVCRSGVCTGTVPADDGTPCRPPGVGNCFGEGQCLTVGSFSFCVPGDPVECPEASDPCKISFCNPSTGECQESDKCFTFFGCETCDAGTCTPIHIGEPCPNAQGDFNECTTDDRCVIENFPALTTAADALNEPLPLTAARFDAQGEVARGFCRGVPGVGPSATPTSMGLPTATATSLPHTATPTQSISPTTTRTASALPTVTFTLSAVPTGTPTITALPTATITQSALPTASRTASALPTATITQSPVPTASRTESALPTATRTQSAAPTATHTQSPLPTVTSTQSAVPTASRTPSGLPTATTTEARTPTSTPPGQTTTPASATPTSPPVCIGDCNGDREVTVDEVLTMVNLALGTAASPCSAGDANHDGEITIDEILRAINVALSSCA